MKILLMPIYFRLFFAFVLPALSVNGQSDSVASVKPADTVQTVATSEAVQTTLPGMSIVGFESFTDTLQPYQETGTASWYGPKSWNGRKTSSGELFYLDSLTAAHKSLPFGTVVKVTNKANDSVVYVKITDRLPQNSKRCIDLTPRAARQLGFYSKGLTKVEILAVGNAPVVSPTRGAKKSVAERP